MAATTTPKARQARREDVSRHSNARQLIETVRDMTDDELEQLRSALNGEAVTVHISPKRAYSE
jgi:microsomal dipeptidase-like Zn-dependent dipeptidase